MKYCLVFIGKHGFYYGGFSDMGNTDKAIETLEFYGNEKSDGINWYYTKEEALQAKKYFDDIAAVAVVEFKEN